MDRNKLIVIGVLVLLVGALAFSQRTPAPSPNPNADAAHFEGDGHDHSADDGHGHSEGDGHDHSADSTTPAATAPAGDVTELQKTDLKVGTGKVAKTGDQVTVHYVGKLTDGTKFDASTDRGEPFVFPLGDGQVIKGWDEGVVGMKEGGKRKLVIPPDMGYGAQGAGGTIPPNATLVFEVELLKVG